MEPDSNAFEEEEGEEVRRIGSETELEIAVASAVAAVVVEGEEEVSIGTVAKEGLEEVPEELSHYSKKSSEQKVLDSLLLKEVSESLVLREGESR